jgi:hypothetical protein
MAYCKLFYKLNFEAMKSLIWIFNFIILFSLSDSLVKSQTKMTKTNRVKIAHIDNDFSAQELDHVSWNTTGVVTVDKYWSGKNAPNGRHFEAKLLWSKTALYIRFEANQAEPLIVSQTPNLKSKTDGLWNRDVCEIFVAPDKSDFHRYFEFEIAPNGEWIDLGIHQLAGRRKVDLEYNSGMQSAAKIEKDKVRMAIKIEWKAFNKTPKAGDIWLGNIFRCIGSDPNRGYLSWQATKTKTPNFHVPTAFGELEFVK